ncbi:uncharacterized protein LAESUDRAFT_802663 [Laetiporus sulphureus 93-53]|uniref:GRIP domain-containing protein n=1 Tax=Laetiporus sulphureus 93-53 TaxID=1314785 RepID=A0A165B8R4_9APHY|nr:uncharacterized protein LAESUDRAFT_802663 [Laetiporus sulphureus 93-53]KZT00503.1 hypothetical protein LAESUDRAFT_802663 [Laetiporus sulphureus 93-53]
MSEVSELLGPSPRPSLDGERPPTSNGTNGAADGHEPDEHEQDDAQDPDPVERLQRELQRTKEEKDALALQYRNLLSKLTAMRTTVANKLKQDAEELDRQDQLVQQLTARNDDLTQTVETLKAELIASNEEANRASRELEAMRSRALQESAHESHMREQELRETQAELEQCRMERDEWEQKALQEHIAADEARSTLANLRREIEVERTAKEMAETELGVEREKCTNLQSVLEDFQAAKDHDLEQATKDYESQLQAATQSLAEFKHRALNAELQLEESSTDTSRLQDLEKEVKEKKLLIGKLRHEAVIMNEHLMEALRRLRQSSTDTNVDRRLVTNVLLSFLTTPRGDTKRFEMLSLLATILSWNDDERERAGLQHKSSSMQAPSPFSGLLGRSSTSSPSKGKALELDKTDETESFSRLWVEFLLTEAAAGESPTRALFNGSLPSTPTRSSRQSGTFSPPTLRETTRLPSFTNAAVASTPDLPLRPPPTGKGKERANS